MNTSPARIIAGIAIIVLGVGSLLGSLDLLDFSEYLRQYWPLSLVGLGITMLISNAKNYLWALIIIAAGVGLQLRALDIINFNIFSLFWPIVLITVGISILSNKSANTARNIDSKARDDVVAILGGADNKYNSKDYKGGKATALLGGVKLDLRKAIIQKEATLELTAFWGGIEILVPEDWHVKSSVSAILGGIEDKSSSNADKHAPVLHLVGDVIMAGVEIKN